MPSKSHDNEDVAVWRIRNPGSLTFEPVYTSPCVVCRARKLNDAHGCHRDPLFDRWVRNLQTFLEGRSYQESPTASHQSLCLFGLQRMYWTLTRNPLSCKTFPTQAVATEAKKEPRIDLVRQDNSPVLWQVPAPISAAREWPKEGKSAQDQPMPSSGKEPCGQHIQNISNEDPVSSLSSAFTEASVPPLCRCLVTRSCSRWALILDDGPCTHMIAPLWGKHLGTCIGHNISEEMTRCDCDVHVTVLDSKTKRWMWSAVGGQGNAPPQKKH